MTPEPAIVSRLQSLCQTGGCRLTEAPPATQKWLRENSRLSPDLVSILCISWPSDDVSIGLYDLWSLEHLSESERSKIAFVGGFFLIGGAGNGDLLVVRRRPDAIHQCEIGLISHEELWERELDLESIYEPICLGFMTLLNDAALDDALPLDFYDARKRKGTG